MKRCKGVTSLDYAVDGNLIYPFVFHAGEDFWTLIDLCESGKLVEKTKKRRRGA